MTFKFPISYSFILPIVASLIAINYLQLSLANNTLRYISVYIVFFLFGIGFSLLLPNRRNLRIRRVAINGNRLLIFVVFLFALYTGLNIDRLLELSSGYSRSAEASGLLSTILELIISVLALYYTHKYWYDTKPKYLLPYIMVVLISVLAASRAVIIIHTLFLVGSGLSIKGSLIKFMRIMIISAAVVLCLFVGIGFYRGSFNTSKGLFEIVFAYMFGGLFAFESFYELNNDEWAFSVLNILPGFTKLLNMFGLPLDVNNYKYTAVTFPFITNIYTSFREIITSFGVKGSIIFALFHGYLSGKLDVSWNKSCLNARVLGPIVLTGNLYFLFYPITMYVFVVVYVLILPFFKLK